MSDINVLQYCIQPNGSVHGVQAAIPSLRLNTYYNFKGTFMNISECSAKRVIADERRMFIGANLKNLINTFAYFTVSQFIEMCREHRIIVPTTTRKDTLLQKLSAHECNAACSSVVYEFETRNRERRYAVGQLAQQLVDISVNVERIASGLHNPRNQTSANMDTAEDEASDEEAELPEFDTSHLSIADRELRETIVKEWEQCMGTKAHLRYICACCSKKTPDHEMVRKRASKVPFHLLRNDELPAAVLPTTYNFEAYERALLHPKGLTNIHVRSDIWLCTVCWRSLDKGEMPKFALANWLYFGYDELPGDARMAFEESSRMERLLVSRARLTRICFKYSEDPEHTAAKDPTTSQKYNRGNIMVMPQDALHVQQVLPPNVDEIRDTVCAIFVGKEKPSKESIRRMHPMLVRKSRVLKMAQYLTVHNPHYQQCESFDGFDGARLNELFTRDDDADDAVPFGVEIGHVPLGEGLESSTADYTPRNRPTSQRYDDELVMENIGYTSGDQSPEAVREMKACALKHCLDGKPFVSSSTGNRYVPDFNNPNLLSWAFPHLDPWGIAGFHHPKRKVQLSMNEQLRHLLLSADPRFEKDSDFTFVFYNVMQKLKVYQDVRYKVPSNCHHEIVKELLKINPDELESLEVKFKNDPLYKPSGEREKNIVNLLARVNLVGTQIPGSAAYKLKLRNEIRSVINYRGTPTLFVTLNPSDVDNPIVRVLGGESVDIEDQMRGEDMEEHKRRVYAANHPAACALFFHSMISSFIKVILRHGQGQGLFGKCTAYYGTVETQARGTLHCHMLIWLDGHPSPQALRDKMAASEEYKLNMFQWLESVIKNELPSDQEVVLEPSDEPLPKPSRSAETGDGHPGVVAPPCLVADDFSCEYNSFVEALAKEYNWHVHNGTCWKYMKGGKAPGDKESKDKNCRMRMDGVTREVTTLDPDTSSILLRRLHPRVASYNDLVLFLMRCNTDIKFIGSGEAAKALVYYVTDYITKAALPTHLGLAALSFAIRKANKKFPEMFSESIDANCRSALTMTVNSMLARQEISHQHVMAYLIGGGDHYASDTFRILYMTAFSRFIGGDVEEGYDISSEGKENVIGGGEDESHLVSSPRTNKRDVRLDEAVDGGVGNDDETRDPELHRPIGDLDPESMITVMEEDPERMPSRVEDVVNVEGSDDDVILNMEKGGITATSQQYDYMYRSVDKEFSGMNLYEFVSKTRTVKQPRQLLDEFNEYDSEPEYLGPGRFSNPRHPLYDTHMLSKKDSYCIPVILGPKIPRRAANAVSEQRWARAMLILFKPWRRVSDLKSDVQTWLDAYLDYEPSLKPKYKRIIHHMDVLSECRDARSEYSRILEEQRGSHDVGSLVEDALDDLQLSGAEAGFGAVFDSFDNIESGSTSVESGNRDGELFDAVLGKECASAINKFLAGLDSLTTDGGSGSDRRVTIPRENIEGHAALMKQLKRKRRPDVHGEVAQERPSKRRRVVEVDPHITVATVDDPTNHTAGGSSQIETFDEIVEDLIVKQNLDGNVEQERAFRIVAEHIRGGSTEPLLLYMGGVGGTGKSHVIKSLILLFERLQRRHQLLVGAPTGIASILIQGHTVHALLNLPDKNKTRLKELRELWKPVLYLIIDEVSMISAKFLSEISSRLRHAKGDDNFSSAKLFGGVSVIFTGDFAQLKPVRASALYRHELVKNPAYKQCKDSDGVSTLNGAYLWRQVDKVVILKKNVRQEGDPVYSKLLNRVRIGKSHSTAAAKQGGSTTRDLSDLDVLRSRQLSNIIANCPEEAEGFSDAPVIVGTRRLRDAINAKMIRHHSAKNSQVVYTYLAKDFIASEPVKDVLKRKLLSVSSTITEDALGKLPLFEGMKVMITSNLAISNKIVNGTEGEVEDVVYTTDDEGHRYATVVYVRIKGVGKLCDDLEDDVVPIFAERNTFKIQVKSGRQARYRYVSRLQVPIVPAYAYTDYKSQGRTLKKAIVDLASVRSLQGAYVMLSRVHSLKGLAILRWFPATKIHQRPPQDLREELERLDNLHRSTANYASGMMMSGDWSMEE